MRSWRTSSRRPYQDSAAIFSHLSKFPDSWKVRLINSFSYFFGLRGMTKLVSCWKMKKLKGYIRKSCTNSICTMVSYNIHYSIKGLLKKVVIFSFYFGRANFKKQEHVGWKLIVYLVHVCLSLKYFFLNLFSNIHFYNKIFYM